VRHPLAVSDTAAPAPDVSGGAEGSSGRSGVMASWPGPRRSKHGRRRPPALTTPPPRPGALDQSDRPPARRQRRHGDNAGAAPSPFGLSTPGDGTGCHVAVVAGVVDRPWHP